MWDEDEPTDRKSLSMKQETRLSQEIGFDLTPGSGNQPWPGMKGDGSHPQFQFELKRTKTGCIVVGEGDIAKICLEAARLGKDPAVVMTIEGMADHLPSDWVAIPAEAFRWLLSRI